MKNIRWKTLLALGMVYVAVLFSLYWLIGLLFLWWTYESIRTKKAYIIEEIKKESHPILYWVIVLTWFVVGLFYFEFFNSLFLKTIQ